MPGSLKNALDWLVGGSEIPGLPVALVNASASSVHAQASLAETRRTMAARVVDGSPFLAAMSGLLDEAAAAVDPGPALGAGRPGPRRSARRIGQAWQREERFTGTAV